MIDRRRLLKSISALPFFKFPSKVGEVDTVELPSGRVIVFVNDAQVDGARLREMQLDKGGPLEGAQVVAVHPRPGLSVSDEVAFYVLDERGVPVPHEVLP